MKLTIEGTPEEVREVLHNVTGSAQGKDLLRSAPGVIARNFNNPEWDDDEIAAIEKSEESGDAVRAYREKFQYKRSKAAIRRMWLKLRNKQAAAHKPADGLPTGPDDLGACSNCDNGKDGEPFSIDRCDECTGTPVSEGGSDPAPVNDPKPRGKRGGAVNAANRWSKEEKAVVDKAPDHVTAWKNYREKFPESPRNENAIYQRWYAKHPGSRKKVKRTPPPKHLKKKQPAKDDEPVINIKGAESLPDPDGDWTLEEDAAIRECPTEDMALTHFQNKYPESDKTAVQVSMRWQFLRGSQEEVAAGEAL